MIEDELIKIWQSSNNQERIKFKKSKLMMELASSMGRLHRWWKYLALLEVVSSIIGIVAFVFISFWVPFVSTKIASLLLVVFLSNILIRVMGITKLKPNDLEANYLVYLKKTLVYLEAQKKLLTTWIYWGGLPLIPIMFLFFFDIWERPATHRIILVVYVSMLAMLLYGYLLNQRRVKNEINPRISKVSTVIKELEV